MIDQKDPSFTFEDLHTLKNYNKTQEIYRKIISKILKLHGITIKKNCDYTMSKEQSKILIDEIDKILPFLNLIEDEEYSEALESIRDYVVIDLDEKRATTIVYLCSLL